WPRGDARAKADELAPALERLGRLTAVGGPAFAMTRLHYASAVGAAKRINAEGITTGDERGLPRKDPLHRGPRGHGTSLRAHPGEVGLSPSSRVRLALPGQEDEGDEYEEFGRRGQAKGG